MSYLSVTKEYAPEVLQLVDLGFISTDYAESNRKLAIIVGDFIANNLANDPLVLAMFGANDWQHFIEGFQAQRSYFEARWVDYLGSQLSR